MRGEKIEEREKTGKRGDRERNERRKEFLKQLIPNIV